LPFFRVTQNCTSITPYLSAYFSRHFSDGEYRSQKKTNDTANKWINTSSGSSASTTAQCNLQFPYLKTAIWPFVPRYPVFHLITDIDATTGRTANQRAVPKSAGNLLQSSVMLF
ncbi:hypothetical protein PV325_010821, partial [Microctonus aethiopoides]